MNRSINKRIMLITIFTPIYNRAHTVSRVYDSLCRQTVRGFEWLVVDDGSTDDLDLHYWTADFPVRYFKQNNSGKHIAYNLALSKARGRFFATLDSDDELKPDAIETLLKLWNTIPEKDLDKFYSVGGLSINQDGTPTGGIFPTDPFDTDHRSLHYVHKIKGEKFIMGLTDVFRRYRFPEIKGTYMPEGVVWLDIAKKFKTRWTNKIVRIYHTDTIGPTVSKIGRKDHHRAGRRYYYKWLLKNDLKYFFYSPLPFIKAIAGLIATIR